MLKLESVYYLGICFERFFLAHKFNANQTKQVNKQKCTKKIDGGRNKRKRNEGIHSESAASQQHVYHMFYCLSRYIFVHPLLRYLLLLHLLQLFGNCKCCFLDRIAAEMLIGFATNRWKWNEWGKHPNICLNALIHVVMSCDILAIQNISWPFDLRERIFELWQFDRRKKVK